MESRSGGQRVGRLPEASPVSDGVLTGEVEIVDLTNNVILTTYNVNFVKFEVEN